MKNGSNTEGRTVDKEGEQREENEDDDDYDVNLSLRERDDLSGGRHDVSEVLEAFVSSEPPDGTDNRPCFVRLREQRPVVSTSLARLTRGDRTEILEVVLEQNCAKEGC